MEYRGSRKSATRSRRSSENTTYYNKPFRWVQVVGSRLLSAFQLLSQCHLSFVSFVHAGHGYMCILFSYRFLRSSTSQEFQTFRVPLFSSGILEIGEQISAKKRATRIDFVFLKSVCVRSFSSFSFFEKQEDERKNVGEKRIFREMAEN